jgi:hypothetical protein
MSIGGFFYALQYKHTKIIERYHEEPSIGFSRNIKTVPKKMFFIRMLEFPEELNDVILHYLFKNPSVFPVYVPNDGSCCIL